MRRRREEVIKETIGEALKSEAKGLLGTIVRLFLNKLIEIIFNALTKPKTGEYPLIDINGENEFI